MKSLLSLLLAAAMLCSITVPQSFAAAPEILVDPNAETVTVAAGAVVTLDEITGADGYDPAYVIENYGVIAGGSLSAGTIENRGEIRDGAFTGSVTVNNRNRITGGAFGTEELEGQTVTVNNHTEYFQSQTVTGGVFGVHSVFNNECTGVTGGDFYGTVTTRRMPLGGGHYHAGATVQVGTLGTIGGGTFDEGVILENSGGFASIDGGVFYCPISGFTSITGGVFYGDVTVQAGNVVAGGSFYGEIRNYGEIHGIKRSKIPNIYGHVENEGEIYGTMFADTATVSGSGEIYALVFICYPGDFPLPFIQRIILGKLFPVGSGVLEGLTAYDEENTALNTWYNLDHSAVEETQTFPLQCSYFYPDCLYEVQSNDDERILYIRKDWDGQTPAPPASNTYDRIRVNFGTTLSGGIWEKPLTNWGNITDGTFTAAIQNTLTGVIEGGTFTGETVNDATLAGGVFRGHVVNRGTVTDGRFAYKENAFDTQLSSDPGVTNEAEGEILGGVFTTSVVNHGSISGGAFAGRYFYNRTGTVTGGTIGADGRTVYVYNENTITGCDYVGLPTPSGNASNQKERIAVPVYVYDSPEDPAPKRTDDVFNFTMNIQTWLEAQWPGETFTYLSGAPIGATDTFSELRTYEFLRTSANRRVTFRWSEDEAGNRTAIAVVSDGPTLQALVTVETIAPTCTEDGTVTYTATVEYAGVIYTDVQSAPVERLGHSFTDYRYNEDATCEEDGTETAQCDNGCGEVSMRTAQGTKSGHSYGTPVFSFAADGKSATACFTCERDGRHTIEILVSTVGEVTEEPACETMGVTTYTATVEMDGRIYTATMEVTDIPSAGHIYENGRCRGCGQIDPDIVYTVGDINNDGRITTADLTFLREYLAGMSGDIQLTAAQYLAADVNGDGKISTADITALRELLSGKG